MKTKYNEIVILPLLILVSLFAMPAAAQVNYAVFGGTAYVASSPNASGNIVIASTYNGYPVTSIGYQAFEYCTSLTSVTIPNSVSDMGSYAFQGCASLTNIAIDNGVNIIGDHAFYNCTSLTSVSLGDNVTSIGHWAFASCTSLGSVTIPNTVTSIGASAFASCTSLTSVSLGNSVTSIGGWAFENCTSVTNFSVASANGAYSSLNGVLFNKAQTSLIAFPASRGGSYVIPNSVISIGEGAFFACTGLASVTIPNSVTIIGEEAFYDCHNLTSVAIPNSVTNIGDYAFIECNRLTNLTFLGNAPSLGFDVFAGVDMSAKVYYYYGTTGWGPTYGGLPTVMLYPPPQVGAGSAGVKPGGFGFTFTGGVNQTIVIEASTNLVNWQSIWTNTLSTVSTDFVDPDWVNHPRRFYRLRSN